MGHFLQSLCGYEKESVGGESVTESLWLPPDQHLLLLGTSLTDMDLKAQGLPNKPLTS